MATENNEELIVVPLAGAETEEERRRIRTSNDRDQQLDREGRASTHNAGYDEVADLKSPVTNHSVDETLQDTRS